MARRSDYLSAAGWAVLGFVILAASLRMDRLEKLSINPWSMPGLTPAVVGALMIVLAAALAWQASRTPVDDTSSIDAREIARDHAPDGALEDARVPETATGASDADGAAALSGPSGTGSVWRTVAAAALCVLFAGVSLGHGLPFVVEGALFIFVFTTTFSLPTWRDEGRVAAGLLQTLVVAVVAAALIAWLFESVFLVRLP